MKQALRKTATAAITLALVSVMVFALIELLPGDPARIIAGEFATEQGVEDVRDRLQLDDPAPTRYVRFVTDAATGDLGDSVTMRPGAGVVNLITETLPVTVSLIVVALAMALVVAVPLGYVAASRPGSLLDRLISALSSTALAVPPFVLGLVLVTNFAVSRSWFPALGYQPLGDGFGGWLHRLILPAVTLATVSAAELTRQTRGAFVDVLERNYIRTAVAKGMPRRVVVWKHALKNAATPVLAVTGLQIARLIGGAIVVERIFVLPGLGSLAVGAVAGRDFPIIQGIVLFTAAVVVVLHLLIDMFDLYLNPRARV